MNFTLGGTDYAHGTYAAHAGERGGDLVVQDLIQGGNTLLCRSGQHKDRDIVRAELEDNGGGDSVRQVG